MTEKQKFIAYHNPEHNKELKRILSQIWSANQSIDIPSTHHQWADQNINLLDDKSSFKLKL